MKDNECNEILPNMTLVVALELKTVPEALATMRQSSFKKKLPAKGKQKWLTHVFALWHVFDFSIHQISE